MIGIRWCLFAFLFSALFPRTSLAQQSTVYGIEVNPISVEGAPIRGVVIILEMDGREILTDSVETTAFYNAFGLKPGGQFRQQVADLAAKRIEQEPGIQKAEYHVYNSEVGGPIVLVVKVWFGIPLPQETKETKKTLFPVITETSRAKLTFILNGAVGLYNEQNALFAQGPAFTQGNPVADNPAVSGPRFWGEFFVEPGIAGITQLGNTKAYPYAAVSYLASGRNTSDIYSKDGTAFGAFERMYAGVLLPRLGKNKNIKIDMSAGRQFFQLNDGFLFSRFSGSSNAGERGSVYLNSRTTYEMTGLVKLQYNKVTVDGFFLEPQELFKSSQSNTRFLGGTVNFNNNKHIDAGVSYISVPSTKSQYATPQGSIPMEGMYIINPKLWLNNISNTGLFFKSEFALQRHSTADMESNAWYVGGGIVKRKWKHSPSLYYRYAYMKGDDPDTPTYERFDAIQTGGLGNWVQGINFRKVNGDGNIVSHRVELKGYIKRNFELSVDYFFLRADNLSNLGSLAPISNLSGKSYCHEITGTARYFIGRHFLFLGVLSWSKPGEAITRAFESKTSSWTSFQAAMFMFF
jgi:hypothetical protein